MAKRASNDILSAILETLDEIFVNQKKEQKDDTKTSDGKKGNKKKKIETSKTPDNSMDLNSSFNVIENLKFDKQKT
jgi:hypothetical protein